MLTDIIKGVGMVGTVLIAYEVSCDVWEWLKQIACLKYDDYILHNIQQKYEIVEHIGSGKTAKIYKAIRKADNRVVALKVLSSMNYVVLESDAPDIERKYLKVLHHPNIVQYYGCEEHVSYSYLVIEYSEEGCLLQYIKQRNLLTERQAIGLVVQLISAIRYLYEEHRIYHRDIKPENILIFKKTYSGSSIQERFCNAIRRENELVFKLCDFGFCGNDNVQCGTEYYTHPRIFKGETRHSLETELWSVGIVVYLCLFGENPYREYMESESKKEFDRNSCTKTKYMKSLGESLRKILRYCLAFVHTLDSPLIFINGVIENEGMIASRKGDVF